VEVLWNRTVKNKNSKKKVRMRQGRQEESKKVGELEERP
jgi:hypothetical protein